MNRGNPCSPMLDRQCHVVGLVGIAVDGNIHSLVSPRSGDDRQTRVAGVHAGAIRKSAAPRRRADALVRELLGRAL